MKIEVTEGQARLINRALDFYSRVGIAQFWVIKDHPTFERIIENECRPRKEPEVGDRTPQGEILRIEDGKALIAGSVKDGLWNEEHEWKDLEYIKLSTDYSKYHEIRDAVDMALIQPRNMLIQDLSMPQHGSFGIHNKKVDDSCRQSFDIYQDIRHHFWKKDPNRSNITVDSSVHYSSKRHKKVKISD